MSLHLCINGYRGVQHSINRCHAMHSLFMKISTMKQLFARWRKIIFVLWIARCKFKEHVRFHWKYFGVVVVVVHDYTCSASYRRTKQNDSMYICYEDDWLTDFILSLGKFHQFLHRFHVINWIYFFLFSLVSGEWNSIFKRNFSIACIKCHTLIFDDGHENVFIHTHCDLVCEWVQFGIV